MTDRHTERHTDRQTPAILLSASCYAIAMGQITRFKHVKSFTKVKNLKCERSQCHRRNARLYRAVLSLDLKVAMLTVISED